MTAPSLPVRGQMGKCENSHQGPVPCQHPGDSRRARAGCARQGASPTRATACDARGTRAPLPGLLLKAKGLTNTATATKTRAHPKDAPCPAPSPQGCPYPMASPSPRGKRGEGLSRDKGKGGKEKRLRRVTPGQDRSCIPPASSCTPPQPVLPAYSDMGEVALRKTLPSPT